MQLCVEIIAVPYMPLDPIQMGTPVPRKLLTPSTKKRQCHFNDLFLTLKSLEVGMHLCKNVVAHRACGLSS